MEYRSLGRTGVNVSPLCLGAMNFGGATSEADSIKIIHAALDGGINFVDTANVYNGGQSEIVVGKALQGRRQQVILATKVHGRVGDGPNDQGNSRLHILKACEDSCAVWAPITSTCTRFTDPDWTSPRTRPSSL